MSGLVGGRGGEADCRLCGSHRLTTLISESEWLDFAATCTDERARHAAQINSDSALAFGGIVRCAACGFYSVARVPTPDALTGFYQNYFANQQYADKGPKKIRRAERWLRRLGALPRAGTFVDVGCNQGFAVEAARLVGMDASGIEIDASAVQNARARFPHCAFENATVAEHAATHAGRYDLVWCSEVLEHVPDFKGFARDLATLVKPGGRLYLTTPDAGHWRRPRDLTRWAETKPPEHINWFTRSNLRTLFAPHGLEVRFLWRLKPGAHMVAQRPASAQRV